MSAGIRARWVAEELRGDDWQRPGRVEEARARKLAELERFSSEPRLNEHAERRHLTVPTAGVRDAYLADRPHDPAAAARLGDRASRRAPAPTAAPRSHRLESRTRPADARPEPTLERTSPRRASPVRGPVFDAIGSSPDGSHAEESFAVIGASRETCVAIGARFGQDAIFELTTTEQIVVGCDGTWELTRPTDSRKGSA